MTRYSFTDTVSEVSGVRETKAGYLVADARVGRTGIQLYNGAEVGRPDLKEVRVYRPKEEVFSKDAMSSLANKPMTLQHPPVSVDASNWSKYAKGHSGGDVVRDGEFVRVPLMLTDGAAIRAFKKGTRELSIGYTTDLKFTPGTTDSGEPFDCIQTDIQANHIALVPAARGGEHLRFGDGKVCPDCGETMTKEGKKYVCDCGKSMPVKDDDDMNDASRRRADPGDGKSPTKDGFGRQHTGKTTMNIVMIGDAKIEVADALSATVVTGHIKKLETQLADAMAASAKANLEKEEAERKRTTGEDAAKKVLDAKEGELAVERQKVKDAAITPEKLNALVTERTAVVDAASKMLGAVDGLASKTNEEIRRAAVSAKLGDAWKDPKVHSDDAINGAFNALVASADTKQGGFGMGGIRQTADSISLALRTPGPVSLQDVRDKAYADRDADMSNAWKTAGQKSA